MYHSAVRCSIVQLEGNAAVLGQACFALFGGGPFISDITLAENAKRLVDALELMGVSQEAGSTREAGREVARRAVSQRGSDAAWAASEGETQRGRQARERRSVGGKRGISRGVIWQAARAASVGWKFEGGGTGARERRR